MSTSSIIIPIKSKQKGKLKEITSELNSFIYLPNWGLQGEDIPSHLLWMNAKADRAKISFSAPLKCKQVFNVERFVINDNEVIIEKLELEGYIGLTFETSKIDELQIVVPIEYSVYMSNGDVIKEIKEIKLFKPQLEIEVAKNREIKIDPKTKFIKGRIKIKNVGRGTSIIRINSTEGSTLEIVTPPEQREYAEKFNTDLFQELDELTHEFPKFKPILKEMIEWNEKDYTEIFSKLGNEFLDYINRLANTLANDKELLEGFVESYLKAATKNSEYIESIRRLVKIFESMVSQDIVLTNPLDELVFHGKNEQIILEIFQTDKVFGEYDEIVLPPISVFCSESISIPIYRLFDWG